MHESAISENDIVSLSLDCYSLCVLGKDNLIRISIETIYVYRLQLAYRNINVSSEGKYF